MDKQRSSQSSKKRMEGGKMLKRLKKWFNFKKKEGKATALKKKKFCEIPSCKGKTGGFSSNKVFYYRGLGRNKNVRVCFDCKQTADHYIQKCKEARKRGETIFNLKPERVHSTSDVGDLAGKNDNDTSDGEENDDDEETLPTKDLLRSTELVSVDCDGSLAENIESILTKYDFKGQMDGCKEKLDEEITHLETGMNDLNKLVDFVGVSCDNLTDIYNKNVADKVLTICFECPDVEEAGNTVPTVSIEVINTPE